MNFFVSLMLAIILTGTTIMSAVNYYFNCPFAWAIIGVILSVFLTGMAWHDVINETVELISKNKGRVK